MHLSRVIQGSLDEQNLSSLLQCGWIQLDGWPAKAKMAAQQGTNDNTCGTLYKDLQHKVHEMKVCELKQFF